jgi:hypothetical protein
MKKSNSTITEDITVILKDLWMKYKNNETEEEFLIKFFANTICATGI